MSLDGADGDCDSIHGDNFTNRSVESSCISIPVNHGFGCIRRISVTEQAGFLHASCIELGIIGFAIHGYIALPEFPGRIFVKEFYDFQLFRAGLVCRVTGIVR